MDKVHKNKKFKSITKKLLSIFIAVFAIFLVACGEADAAYDQIFDANGYYRLFTPSISYYEETTDGKQNEHTGSFLVPLEFYRNETTAQVESQYNTITRRNGIKFNRDFDQQGALGFYNLDTSKLVYPDYTFYISGGIYQVHVQVDTSKLEIVARDTQITGSENSYYGNGCYISLASGANLSDAFKFYFRKGTSGEWIDASNFIYPVVINSNGDVSLEHSETSDEKFYMCFHPWLESGTVSRSIRVKAVPNLGQSLDMSLEENKTASLKSSDRIRGDSKYSQTIVFNAYKMSFSTNSSNSAFLDYGQLSYDSTRYYFYNLETTYSTTTREYYLTSISGYFPAGQIVEVTQTFDSINASTSDYYGMQSWSLNKKATNSLVLQDSFVEHNASNPYDQFEDPAAGFNCIFGNKSENASAVMVYKNTEVVPYSTRYENTCYSIYNTVSSNAERTHTIYVGSNQEYSGGVFYANYVKVGNYTLSGALFNAESILDTVNSRLQGVGYDRYDGSNQLIQGSSGSLNSYEFNFSGIGYGDYYLFSKSEEVDGTTLDFKFYGSMMSELLINDVDAGNVLSNTVKNDTYYYAVKITDFSGKTYYLAKDEFTFVYQNKSLYFHDGVITDSDNNVYSNFIYTYYYQTKDLTNIPILATKYDDDSSLVVNVYAYSNGGLTDPTNLGISYEVIESVDSYVDALGYVTTTVYVSVILPSNATIQSYNVVTDNSISANIYTNENGNIVDSDYSSDYFDDENTEMKMNKILELSELDAGEIVQKYYLMYIYSNNYVKNNITLSTNSTIIYYNNETFVYGYKNSYEEVIYSIYNSSTSNNMLVSYANNGTTEYNFIKLELIDYSSNSSDLNLLNKNKYTNENGNSVDYIYYNGYIFINGNLENFMVNSYSDTFLGNVVDTNVRGDFAFTYEVLNTTNAGIYNGETENTIYYNKTYSYIQSTYSGNTDFKLYNGDKTVGTTTIKGAKVDGQDYFYNVTITDRLPFEEAKEIKSYKAQPNYFTSTLEKDSFYIESNTQYVTYYTFLYNNVVYYYVPENQYDSEGNAIAQGFYTTLSEDTEKNSYTFTNKIENLNGLPLGFNSTNNRVTINDQETGTSVNTRHVLISVDCYLFTYNGLYYYYLDKDYTIDGVENKKGFYTSFDYAQSKFENQVDELYFGYSYNADVANSTISFDRRYIEYDNNTIYYLNEMNQTLHLDRFCESDPVNFTSLYGYSSYNIADNELRLFRYYVNLNNKKYYININTDALYTNFMCTSIWQYVDDSLEINFAYDNNGLIDITNSNVEISSTFVTELAFNYGGTTHYIADLSFKLKDSNHNNVTNFVYYGISLTKKDSYNWNISFKTGSTSETYLPANLCGPAG